MGTRSKVVELPSELLSGEWRPQLARMPLAGQTFAMRYLFTIVYHLPISGILDDYHFNRGFPLTPSARLAPTRTCNLRLQHARACSLGQASPPRPSEWESPYYFRPCTYIRPRLSQDLPSDTDILMLQECVIRILAIFGRTLDRKVFVWQSSTSTACGRRVSDNGARCGIMCAAW